MNHYVETLRRLARPLQPLPTGATPKLQRLDNIRAVLFDVYGTLLISGSGDVGTVAEAPGAAFVSACEAMSVSLSIAGSQGAALLVESIKTCHRQSAEQGVDYPEVDIVSIWRTTLAELHRRSWIHNSIDDVDCRQLAVEYEMRTNPVWPMPAAADCLRSLADANFRLGMISNAQFFTPILFPALFGKSLLELGFGEDLCLFSYRHGRAKPGLFLFQKAIDSVASYGISADQVLYVGNDVLNDIMPAQSIGFRTALFAGDRRSLRRREDDRRVAGVTPDLVITSLAQLSSSLLT